MHTPVLLEEVLKVLNPRSGQIFIDATVNGGGHALAIAERVGEKGRVIGIDWDCDLIRELTRLHRLAKHGGQGSKNKELRTNQITLVCDNYVNLAEIAVHEGIVGKVDGVLFDFGFSSYHVDASGRGFSFLRDEPLDMRYSTEGNSFTAATICNTWSEGAIADVIQRFGEERFAKRIARAIVARRREKRFERTDDLRHTIERAVPMAYRRGRIHPATRTFQALRIAVNHELENVEEGIQAAFKVLKKGGVVAAISFHSLEDRIVKECFRQYVKTDGAILFTKKPITTSFGEIKINPRARSAKLRALQKK